MTLERVTGVDVIGKMLRNESREIAELVARLMAAADKALDANSIRQLGDALNELDAALNACRAEKGERG